MLGIREKQMPVLLCGLVLSGLLTSLTAASAQQQANPGVEKGLPERPVDPGSAASQDVKQPPHEEAPQSLHLLDGRALVIRAPTPITRLSHANPNSKGAQVVTPYQLL